MSGAATPVTPVDEKAGLVVQLAKDVGHDEMSSGSSVLWIDAGQLEELPTAAEHTVSDTVSAHGRYIVRHISLATLIPQSVPAVRVETTFQTVCVLVPNTSRSRSRWQLNGVVGEKAG